MLPAFDDWRSAARFSVLMMVLLLLPVILKSLGLPPRVEVYNGLRVRGGPYVMTRQQMFGSSDDIDIAFAGSSVLNMAINVDYVQDRMVERFGPDVNVRMFGFVFQGFELQYVMIRDLLEHRRVKMLVTSFSGPHYLSDQPHVQLHRLLRYGDYPEAFQGLSFGHKTAIYGSYVLDGPRQLITWLRPEEPVVLADKRRSFMTYDAHPAPPGTPAPPVVLSDATRDQFIFGNPTLTDRERYFAKAIAQLVADHHIPMVILNLPTPEDFGNKEIWERADWRQFLAGPPAVVGFRRSELFPPGVPPSGFYGDNVHLNAEGQDCLTRSLAPYLVDRYADLNSSR